MAFNLRNRSFFKIIGFYTRRNPLFIRIIQRPKKAKYAGPTTPFKKEKHCSLFEKDSTRTRCAFEVAALDQGAHVTYMVLRFANGQKRIDERYSSRIGQNVRWN
jgi:ornithine carbamoyltransferase